MGNLLWTAIVILFVLWLLGAFVANVGSLIHILLVVAIIMVIYNLFMSGKARV